jgi:hypothetical protein
MEAITWVSARASRRVQAQQFQTSENNFAENYRATLTAGGRVTTRNDAGRLA